MDLVDNIQAFAAMFDTIPIDGFRMSCVDVGIPCIFVQASQLSVLDTILPDEAPDLVSRLESIRRSATIAMGLATDKVSVPEAAPPILMVSLPTPYSTLSGENVREDSTDVIIWSLSGIGFHRALQITASRATTVAAKIDGTVAARPSKWDFAGYCKIRCQGFRD
jgi:2-methylaconitate cis-trans-isomerase PrpF